MMPLHALLTLLLIASPSVNSVHANLYADPAYSSQYPEITVHSMGSIVQNHTLIQANFEIELGRIEDIPFLYDESGITVLGNVQQTPRYGLSGEVWVDGEWVNSTFFDTTLADRFVFNCAQEKAVNMSSYIWVEWVAPILEDTTHDGELDIFFEYGAESRILRPPWDVAEAHGSGTSSGSYVAVDNTYVRTGSEAVRFHTPSPPLNDAQRRVELRYYSTGTQEMYVSWWAFFPTGWEANQPGFTTLGGWQSFFGPQDQNYKWFTDGRFKIHNTSRKIMFIYKWGAKSGELQYSSAASALDEEWTSDYVISDYINQWVHFQVYVKWAIDNTGIIRAWFNDNLIAEKINIKTHPEGYPEWNDAGYYRSGQPYPFIVISLYTDMKNNNEDYWVDDVVGAMEKISEGHRVIGG